MYGTYLYVYWYSLDNDVDFWWSVVQLFYRNENLLFSIMWIKAVKPPLYGIEHNFIVDLHIGKAAVFYNKQLTQA